MVTSTNPLLPSRPLLWTFRLLSATALGISGYLAWTAFSAGQVYGCGGGEVFDCSHVLNSQYARIMGIPVSVPAFALYASLLGVLAFFRPTAPDSLLRVGWAMLTVGGISAGLAALWFSGIQFFVLDHLCAYCLCAHACGLILATIVIWKRPLGWMKLAQFSGISAAGLALMITAQVTAEPPQTFVVERFDDSDAVSADTQSTSFAPPSAADEFAAPVEFGAPLQFAAPEQDADIFTPPVVEPPVVDNLFAPPTDAADVPNPQPELQPVTTKPGTPGDEDDVTTSIGGKDGDVSRQIDRETSRISVVSAGALLFFAPSGGNAVVSRLLQYFPGVSEGEEPESSEPGAPQESTSQPATQTVAKPVVPAPVPVRLVTVAGSRFSLNTRHWPLIGDPDAKYVFVEMFDYTCSHCRQTQLAIDGAFERYGTDLAVIALPVPLERACNPAANGNGHPGACEQAKLAVAVWRCDRSKFREFHHWMFETSRTTAQARTKAEQLVGRDRLNQELALGHASSYIDKHVELYRRVGSGAVPKLMFPQSTMTGQVSSATILVKTIQQELAAK